MTKKQEFRDEYEEKKDGIRLLVLVVATPSTGMITQVHSENPKRAVEWVLSDYDKDLHRNGDYYTQIVGWIMI